MIYALVGIGGALGSIARLICSRWLGLTVNGFPLGTLFVNWLGCFLIGCCWAFLKADPKYSSMRLLLITGFLGGFTTFSSFGWESLQLFTEGKWKLALSYILLSNVIGIILVFLGLNFVLKLRL